MRPACLKFFGGVWRSRRSLSDSAGRRQRRALRRRRKQPMADSVWFEVQGDATHYPNKESVAAAALQEAKGTDNLVEVYRCTRTLVRTVQRSVRSTETDVPQST